MPARTLLFSSFCPVINFAKPTQLCNVWLSKLSNQNHTTPFVKKSAGANGFSYFLFLLWPCTQYCTFANHWQMSNFYSNIFVTDWMQTKTIIVIYALLYQLVVLLFESPLIWRVSEEQGKKITWFTEILIGGVTFPIPNGAEFAAFTTYLTCFWFPSVNHVKPSVSIISILHAWEGINLHLWTTFQLNNFLCLRESTFKISELRQCVAWSYEFVCRKIYTYLEVKSILSIFYCFQKKWKNKKNNKKNFTMPFSKYKCLKLKLR